MLRLSEGPHRLYHNTNRSITLFGPVADQPAQKTSMKKYENVAHPNVYFWLKAPLS